MYLGKDFKTEDIESRTKSLIIFFLKFVTSWTYPPTLPIRLKMVSSWAIGVAHFFCSNSQMLMKVKVDKILGVRTCFGQVLLNCR